MKLNKGEFWVKCIDKELFPKWCIPNKKYKARVKENKPDYIEIYSPEFSDEYDNYKNRWATFYRNRFEVVNNNEKYAVIYGLYNQYKETFTSYDRAKELAVKKNGEVYKLVGRVIEKEIKKVEKVFEEV